MEKTFVLFFLNTAKSNAGAQCCEGYMYFDRSGGGAVRRQLTL